MNKLKKLWMKRGGWLRLCLPVAIVALCLAVKAAKPRLSTNAKAGR